MAFLNLSDKSSISFVSILIYYGGGKERGNLLKIEMHYF